MRAQIIEISRKTQRESKPQTRFPADWPKNGPIDLGVHDLPHSSSTTEWWYLNGHCRTEDGRDFSFFAAFFRQLKQRNSLAGKPEYGHSLTWAIHDVVGEKCHNVSRVDPSAAREGLKLMDRGFVSKDDRLNRALREILERGNVPTPDRVIEGRVFVNQQRLELQYGTDCFRKNDDGSYTLKLFDERSLLGCELDLSPLKPPVRHGNNGVVRGPDDEMMFYYFIPRCGLSGRIAFNGEELELSEGQAWYDHEFGVGEMETFDDEAEARLSAAERERIHADRRERRDERQIGWDWLSTQLDDGTDLTVYPLQYTYSGQSAGDFAIIIDPSGNRLSYDDMKLEALEIWQSTQTFFEYPVKWRLRIPSADVYLEIEAAFEDQEFITLISKPSFWEGRVQVKGRIGGRQVEGSGFIERCNFAPYENLDGFFKEVGKVVRKSVRNVIPREPDYEQARDLIASQVRENYLEGVDIEQYARAHIHPIREILDRGGKGWRSYAAITCCDIVGGDSREFVKWLALPEMMHVGSLIVDDVEDKSDVRRGGPTAHLIYGEAQAINSGTAAYFIGHRLLKSDRLSDRDKLRLYDLYFDALRAGHAGQALDIDGFYRLMPEVIRSGNSELLESRVMAVHRLKTAAPAGCLARMGAIGGHGSDEQIEGLGRFFEDLGLAFQIIDDVLNIKGFKGDLKNKGEDIVKGKITMPVAKAMSRLPHDERRWLFESLSAENKDGAQVQTIIDKLEECGAAEACARQARDLIEQGWARLSPLVEDSLAKMLLRAFGWFILERHY